MQLTDQQTAVLTKILKSDFVTQAIIDHGNIDLSDDEEIIFQEIVNILPRTEEEIERTRIQLLYEETGDDRLLSVL